MVRQETSLIEKQVNLGKGQIAYLEGGVAAAVPSIVFLHGWGISARPYHEILDQLTPHYRVIAPDLPNFAQSTYPEVLKGYGEYAEVLLAFLAALKLDRVHLVGHSFGGGIALTIAALAPQRIASLVLVNGTGIPSGSVLEVLCRRAIEMPLQISPAKLSLQFVEIPQVFLPNLLFNLENIIQALFLSLEKDLRALLPLIQAPCLLLWSQHDLTIPVSVAQEFRSRIKNAQLVVVEEGYHEWGLFYPEKFTRLLIEFLKKAVSP